MTGSGFSVLPPKESSKSATLEDFSFIEPSVSLRYFEISNVSKKLDFLGFSSSAVDASNSSEVVLVESATVILKLIVKHLAIRHIINYVMNI